MDKKVSKHYNPNLEVKGNNSGKDRSSDSSASTDIVRRKSKEKLSSHDGGDLQTADRTNRNPSPEVPVSTEKAVIQSIATGIIAIGEKTNPGITDNLEVKTKLLNIAETGTAIQEIPNKFSSKDAEHHFEKALEALNKLIEQERPHQMLKNEEVYYQQAKNTELEEFHSSGQLEKFYTSEQLKDIRSQGQLEPLIAQCLLVKAFCLPNQPATDFSWGPDGVWIKQVKSNYRDCMNEARITIKEVEDFSGERLTNLESYATNPQHYDYKKQLEDVGRNIVEVIDHWKIIAEQCKKIESNPKELINIYILREPLNQIKGALKQLSERGDPGVQSEKVSPTMERFHLDQPRREITPDFANLQEEIKEGRKAFEKIPGTLCRYQEEVFSNRYTIDFGEEEFSSGGANTTLRSKQ